jgi:hypothetical protein
MFSMIPFPVKIMAIIFIVLGAAGWGYMKGSAHAEVELANYQASAEKQISDLKTENTRISDNVVTEYVDRTNTIHDKEIVYRDRLVNLGEGKNNLSNGWVELHDAAARLADPDAVLASDLSPSGVMDNAALAVVLTNYRVAHENKQQLISLQRWIRDNQAAIEAANLKAPKDKK